MSLFNSPETPETEEYEVRKEKYVAMCTACPWSFWRGADKSTTMAMAEGHERMTGHHVLVQGEFHTDSEPVSRL